MADLWGRAAWPRPAGLALVPPGTAFPWDDPDLLWRSVLLVLGPKTVILGQAAYPCNLSTLRCTIMIINGWMLLLRVVPGLTRLISLIVDPGSPLCLGTQAFRSELVNSELIPVGFAWIHPQDHSGQVSCRNSTVDMLVGRTRALQSKHCPFWLKF